MSERPGFEEIPLDLDRVPSVEEGLADAATRKTAMVKAAANLLGRGEKAIFRETLAYMSFVNRACSLHLGIKAAVGGTNPHSAFTLLRAYNELVVLVYYLGDHPEYLDALEHPMAELPRGTRLRFSDLFGHAAAEMPGIRRVYETLNEMAHFGSTALWSPFILDKDIEGRLSFGSEPYWKHPETDPKTALAMLMEADETFLAVLERYGTRHVIPQQDAYENRERIRKALMSVGAAAADDDAQSVGTMPEDVVADAELLGLMAWCEDHQTMELTEDATPDRLEEWVAARLSSHDPEDSADE